MSSQGIAHVGLPKTGSTFLQCHYFSRLPETKLFSTTIPFSWPRQLSFIRPLNWFWYDDLASQGPVLSAEQRKRRFERKVQPNMKRWRHGCSAFNRYSSRLGQWILSAEGLCGSAPCVNALQLKLLKQAGVNKILFVCRNQVDFSQSLWRQILLAENRLARFVSFATFFGSSNGDGAFELDWMPYVDAMDAEFGGNNVLVLPYELLKQNPREFFSRLNAFLGFPAECLMPDCSKIENPSRDDSVYWGLALDRSAMLARFPWLRRRLHQLAARLGWLFPECWRSPHAMFVPAEVLDRLQARFETSNRRLEQRIGLDLRQFGYFRAVNTLTANETVVALRRSPARPPLAM